MNFLAHSLFGFNNSELIAGQFCGDFVRGRDLSRFPHGVEQGIRLHRHLDRYTDTHPALSAARQRMTDVPRRFSGIVLDVMFDHHLACHWTRVSELSLQSHEQRVLAALHLHESHFPEPLKHFMRVLERENILQNNIHLASIELTLARIARRSPNFSVVALSVEQLAPLRDSLVTPFDRFYPDLLMATSVFLSSSGSSNESQRGSHVGSPIESQSSSHGGSPADTQVDSVAGNRKSNTP